ncbi:hypothetical protein DSM107003_01550 [Trichormus variabilis SAG 1403-4b]|uniref:Reverse transcriptase domain-containing protein n=2 Tax=Anabaena variabilis TaxID=264691 RepID=A0A3S1AF29_ANAVA|nr:hypothetical protein DSM107003_01550 [Trichormus variabilis SAG 1403-4b]
MLSAWQNIVKDGMRKQPLLDLHDYYDFHRNRQKIIPIICEQIIKGSYQPKAPNIIRSEKKNGICRHLQLPSPDDAVIFQTLVEKISPIIKKSQPSDRAYYSRSHSQPKSEADIDDSFPYEWWELWPKFQQKIYEFSTTFDYVIVTDVANYFDNISFDRLRNVISSYGQFDEELLDFLFFMLESFVWRPDYLPLSGFGLPQVNFDAPRLFGHAFLFEIDRYLKDVTNNNFVRWMDDIDFGSNDVAQAKKILRDLDELLLTRGLRLNMGKTKILSSCQAKKYFLPNENRFLTIITNLIELKIKQGKSIEIEKEKIRKRFKKFLKLSDAGRWNKVYKRYFTISAKTRDNFLERYVPEILINQPDLRDSVFTNYRKFGYSKKRFIQLINFFISEHCMCDITVFSVAKLLVSWNIPLKSKSIIELIQVTHERMIKLPSSASFVASLWILAKYGNESELFSLLCTHQTVWENSSFLARQVAAIIPILRTNINHGYKIKQLLVEIGHIDAIRVMNNLEYLRDNNKLDKDIIMYLSQGNQGIYPLSKFLIVFDILNSQRIESSVRQKLKDQLLKEVISDSIYINKLAKIEI